MSLYDDGKVVLDDDGITLLRYYFPLATPKRILYPQIRKAEVRDMGWLTGRGRGWGSAHPGFWLPFDGERFRKKDLIVLDVGRRVKPAFSPDEPAEVVRILEDCTGVLVNT